MPAAMRTLPDKYLSEIPLEGNSYQVDLEVLDRYQSFSAELLRLALLCLAGFGFLISNVVFERTDTGASAALLARCRDTQPILSLGALSLAAAAMCALGHRYFSTDSMAHHVRRLRLTRRLAELPASERDELERIVGVESASLRKDLDRCRKLLVGAIVMLVVGTLCAAVTFAVTVSI